MEGLPSGTVTFVFTDIEGSTGLLKQLGDRYAGVLAEHRQIVRNTFTQANGVEIDTQGDAFFFAFARARDAVEAAVEAQRAHASADSPDDATVRVRMGLHTGEPALGSEGYLGIDVVRAARICTTARGGNVLLSETTRSLAGSSLPEGVSVSRLGQRQLKDIDQPEEVYELAIEGVESTTAAVEPGPAAKPPAEFRDRLRESIDERVQRELLAAFGDAEKPVASETTTPQWTSWPVALPIWGTGSALASKPRFAPGASDVRASIRCSTMPKTAALFAALADPARVKIVSQIVRCGGACCACEFEPEVGLSQPTVSHHLKKLTDAGLLEREQRGRWAYFSLNRDAVDRLAAVADLKGACC